MTSTRRRPTLLAVLDQPGDEVRPPGGTLVTSGWRGVRTVLVTMRGGDDPLLRAAMVRAASLLGIENRFHWQAEEEDAAGRLARLMRAFQPSAVLLTRATRALGERAWAQASDDAFAMPALDPLDPTLARLWLATAEGEDASVDVSAARPLLRAAGLLYRGPFWARAETSPSEPVERFAWQAGVPLPSAPVTDLWVGLPIRPARPLVSFLTEESR